jgi:hypothetical protein
MGISATPSADVEMSDQTVPAGSILPEKVIAEIDETHQPSLLRGRNARYRQVSRHQLK